MHSYPANDKKFDDLNRYAVIRVKANGYIQHERHFRVTFWALLANFSALSLGVYSSLSFFLSYLNTYESERAMIQVLY